MKGKAKIDFEQWYKPPYIENNCECGCNTDLSLDVDEFYKLPETMQQGVLLEFFRERGYVVIITYSAKHNDYYYWLFFNGYLTINDSRFPDYNTAFTHAIDKACELYGRGE